MRIVSLNIGATRLGQDFNLSPDDELPPLASLVGLCSFFETLANGADKVVIGLQEVDRCLNMTDGISQAWYFDDKLSPGWVHHFQRILTPVSSSNRLKKYDGHHIPAQFRKYITGCDDAGYGNAVISNVPFTKSENWTFAWDADNPEEYGGEQKGACAVKLNVSNRLLWFVNTHLSDNIIAAERQVWQLVGNTGRFDPSTPIIVVGDFNICKDGYHTRTGIDENHRRVYRRMNRIFEAAGFVQIGEDDGLTFKPWNGYSKIDYVFLFDPDRAGQTFTNIRFQLSKPVDPTNSKRFFTDHIALIVDFEW
jgi:endonuclease/exonuclease/phosphatase family metal-dependent hydrolase